MCRTCPREHSSNFARAVTTRVSGQNRIYHKPRSFPACLARLAQPGKEERQDPIPGVTALVHPSQWGEGNSADRPGPATSLCWVWGGPRTMRSIRAPRQHVSGAGTMAWPPPGPRASPGLVCKCYASPNRCFSGNVPWPRGGSAGWHRMTKAVACSHCSPRWLLIEHRNNRGYL